MLVFVEDTDKEESNSENYYDTPIETNLLSRIIQLQAITEKQYIDNELALKKEIVELKTKCAILEKETGEENFNKINSK